MSAQDTTRINPERTEPGAWTIVDPSGETIGAVDEIYLDLRTGNWDWVRVRTGLFGRRARLVPLAGMSASGQAMRSSVRKDEVEDAPEIDPGGWVSADEEQQLFAYYDSCCNHDVKADEGGRHGRASTSR